VREVALGLIALGRQPGEAVALLSTSRAEWVQADFAIFSAGGITVPVYPTYPPDLIAYVINDSGARTIIVEDPGQLAKVLEIRATTPGLEHIIVMTGYEATQPPKMVMTWEMLRRLGRENAATHASTLAARVSGTKPDDLASIVYTSGTTGPPKGVMQTHGNHIAAQKNSESAAPCEEGWVHLLFLPLAHSFARLESFLGVYRGLCTAFAENLDNYGFEKSVIKGAGYPAVDLGIIPASVALSLGRAALAEDPNADTLWMSCPHWACAEAIDPLEKELGINVVTAQQAITWHA